MDLNPNDSYLTLIPTVLFTSFQRNFMIIPMLAIVAAAFSERRLWARILEGSWPFSCCLRIQGRGLGVQIQSLSPL